MMNLNSKLELKGLPFLKFDEVHIWFACLPDNERDIHHFVSLLSEDERQKADNFRFPKDKNSFIISRGILRSLLAYYLEEEPQNIEIMYGLWGKPCVLAGKSLYFNLSHSKDYVLYAVARNYEVGIDLEYIDQHLEVEDMASSILSSRDLEYWKTIKQEEKANTFFKLWVCKEAFLKASGKGWLNDKHTIPLESLETHKESNKNNELKEKMTSPCFFEDIPGYASALFIEGVPLRSVHYAWNSQTRHVLKRSS